MNAAIQSLNRTRRIFYRLVESKQDQSLGESENGEKAYKLLNNLIGGNSSGLQHNLFDSHGSGGGDTMMNGTPVWQIDGNFGLTSGVAEMLVQSQSGYTQFLPAIPERMGKRRGQRSKGQR